MGDETLNRVDVGRTDIDQVLSEMRALKSRAQGFEPATSSADKINPTHDASALESTSFQQLLSSAVDQVNSVQKQSSNLAEAFQLGDPNVTLSQVVVASEKASIAFEAMSEVRNRLVKAYEDIMKMPI
ncbi:MAG: flagellar hook-basal body complex protein FliE [Pseudomonadota bacterium]|nr:flagellar hook-basal body complex protein FliE [Pseudomonadota bacterium]